MIGICKPKLLLALTGILGLVCFASGARTSKQDAQLPSNPTELVRKVVQNELSTAGVVPGEFLSWKERSIKPNRITVKQYVETPDGLLARLLSLNDKPLSDEDMRKEEARINRLLDPKQMQQKRKQQQEDEARTRKMVSALPDAFNFQYAGTTEKDGRTLVSLKFTPNPNFSPPTRETLVYQGMSGDMTVDTTAMRMAKIDGTMTKDISIGWGIIGHLDKGGRFVVEQSEVEPGDWEVTRMQLNFTGKALIFKTIRIDETDTSFDFRRVPKMTVAEALDFLKKAGAQNGAVAGK